MDLLGVSEKTESEALEVLSTFKNANALTKSFDMKLEDIKSVWSDLFKLIRAQEGKVRLEGLNCARILSRDRAGINEAIDESIVSDLMQNGNIGSEEVNKDVEVTEESLKVKLVVFSPRFEWYKDNSYFPSSRFSLICCSRALWSNVSVQRTAFCQNYFRR